jgi:hypothetical protein
MAVKETRASRTLHIAVWSLGMFLAGWVTHEMYVAGKPIGFSLLMTGIIWLGILGNT